MIAEAMKFEELLKANGSGAFGNVEYDGSNRVILRTAEVKTADMSGTVRLYFDNRREQVLSGRRFDPMGSGLILLRPGQFYRVYTTLEFVEPIPRGVHAEVVTYSDVADILMVTTGTFWEGYAGPVYFTIQPYRKVELERMTSLGGLMFFESGLSTEQDNSDRTKKSAGKSASKKSAATKSSTSKVKAKEGGSDESDIPGEHVGNTEN